MLETKHFAWWPKKVTSGIVVWLAYYHQYRSLYDETTGRPSLNGLHFIWTETVKEKTWRLLKESIIHNRNVWNDPALTAQDVWNLYEE